MKKSVKCCPYYDTLFYPDISNQLLPTNVANHAPFCYFLECHESQPLHLKKLMISHTTQLKDLTATIQNCCVGVKTWIPDTRSSVLQFIYSWKPKNIFPARIYNHEETSPLVLKVNYTHIVRITEGRSIQIFSQIVIVKVFTDLIVIMSDNSK